MEQTDLPKVAGETGRIQLHYEVNSIEKDGERTFNTCVFKLTSIGWFKNRHKSCKPIVFVCGSSRKRT
jgi:hypothetical protein